MKRRLMSVDRGARCSALAAACALLAAPALAALGRPQRLVPANFTAKTDSLGFVWDINQMGVVSRGTNYCFSTAQMLQVNGSSVHCNRPMMTADGSEFVLSCTNIHGVSVTRRVKVDLKLGTARYVDTFTNPGGAPVSLTASLHTNLNSNCQVVVTDTGGPAAAGLGKKSCGLLAVQRPGMNRPSVLFYLAAPRSKTKPAVTVSSGRSFRFTFGLTVPAGKSVSLLTGIAQRRVGGTPDSKALAAMFKPFRSRKWVRDLPADVRRTIVNAGRTGYGDGVSRGVLAAVKALDVTRGNLDVLALGEGSRITGTAACAYLAAETRYGRVEVPFEKVAALVGGKFAAGKGDDPGGKIPFSPPAVLLRDGRVFCGGVEAVGLKFTMSSGLTMKLGIEQLDRLVTRATAEDGRPADEVRAWIETVGGDRLGLVRLDRPELAAGRPKAAAEISVATPWGRRRVRLGELRWLRPAELSGGVGYRVALKDRSRFFAYLEDAAVELDTLAFGAMSFRPVDIRAIETKVNKGPAEDEPEDITRPHVVLTGQNVLVGAIDLPEIGFVTLGEVIRAPPDQIRVMHNMSQEDEATEAVNPIFSAELWGDGIVVGRLLERVLPVRFGDGVWRVPAREILDCFVPAPTVPDALRVKIAALVRDLGHPEWERRTAATRELAELGFVAKRQLTEARRTSTDPEVRKRARDLLDGLKE